MLGTTYNAISTPFFTQIWHVCVFLGMAYWFSASLRHYAGDLHCASDAGDAGLNEGGAGADAGANSTTQLNGMDIIREVAAR